MGSLIVIGLLFGGALVVTGVMLANHFRQSEKYRDLVQ
jgi:hypothetical protein